MKKKGLRDVFREGMVHASIEHPPVYGGTVKRLDDTDALRVKGVRQTVQLCAEYGRRSATAAQARRILSL